ncbi:MAG: hypothetical protein V4773_24065 [Verrucomicrobiota bacterium]
MISLRATLGLLLSGAFAVGGYGATKTGKDTNGPAEAGGLKDASVFEGPKALDEASAPDAAKSPGRPNVGRIELTSAVGNRTFPQPVPAETFWRIFGELDAATKSATSLTIHQGLTRWMKEKEAALAALREKGETALTVREQSFYPEAQAVPQEAGEKLRAAVFGAVKPWRGIKLCGGFHADYLLRWETAQGRSEAQICFGCHELKIVGPAGEIYGDLASEQVNALKELLAPYQLHPVPPPPMAEAKPSKPGKASSGSAKGK